MAKHSDSFFLNLIEGFVGTEVKAFDLKFPVCTHCRAKLAMNPRTGGPIFDWHKCKKPAGGFEFL